MKKRLKKFNRLIDLAKKYNYTCYWCNHKFPLSALSKDHIVPKSKMDKGERARYVLACKCCNMERGDLPFNFYKKYR